MWWMFFFLFFFLSFCISKESFREETYIHHYYKTGTFSFTVPISHPYNPHAIISHPHAFYDNTSYINQYGVQGENERQYINKEHRDWFSWILYPYPSYIKVVYTIKPYAHHSPNSTFHILIPSKPKLVIKLVVHHEYYPSIPPYKNQTIHFHVPQTFI